MSAEVVSAVVDQPSLFVAKAVCDLAGVTYRQLNYWTTNLGVVHIIPIEGLDSAGSGNHRIYSREEAAIAEAVGTLRDIKAAARLLREVMANGSAAVGTLGAFRLVRTEVDQ